MNTRFALIAIASLPLMTAALAQDTSDDTSRDRSLIVGFLEDNLSGAGRDIRIDGFKGFLSSTATMGSLTISDSDGVWFTLNDAVLDWNRSALLAGRLEIEQVSAASIEVFRRPISEESSAAPEASVFSLPELPVSIDIGEITAESVKLGADILGLGEAVELSILGAATLKDGDGSAELEIKKLSGPVGAFTLDAAYNNADAYFDLDLSLTEGPNGIISTLIGLPGAPDLSLVAKGAGPLDTFTADIELATLGQPRLSGTIGLSTVIEATVTDQIGSQSVTTDNIEAIQPKARAFFADIRGDVTPLFDSAYAPFFGASSALSAKGTSFPDGRLTLEAFSLATDTLSLDGAVAIGTDSLPTSFDLSGVIANTSGAPTLLPIAGDKQYLQRAEISAQYDASRGDTWTATAHLLDYTQQDVAIGDVSLDASGTISRRPNPQGSTLLRAFDASLEIIADGIDLDDATLMSTVGSNLSAQTKLSWRDGTPLVLEAVSIDAGDATMTADGTISGLDSGFTFTGNLGVDAARLSRFAAITGLSLQGSLSGDASGSFTPLGGSFDAEITTQAQNARIGIPKVDALLTGQSQVSLRAQRDETGLTLEAFDVKTSAVSAQGSGVLTSTTADLNLTARLDDVARLDAGISGPLTAVASVSKATENGAWQTSATMTGPGGSTARLTGDIAQSFDTAALQVSGAAPLGLANSLTTATLLQGTADFDLRLNGPLALESLAGTISARTDTRAVLPAAGLALTFNQLRATLANANADITANARADTGGSISASGRVGLSSNFAADINVILNNLVVADPDLYTTSVSGNLALVGPVLSGPKISGTLNLGRTDVRVATVAVGAGGDIPAITHKSEPASVRQTRARAGVLSDGQASANSGSSAIALDITVNAANQVYIRGRGLDAELGGKLRLIGTTDNIIPVGQFSLVRGRLNLLGKRIEMEEGQLALQGDFDPSFSLVAATTTDDLTITITTSGQLSSPKIELSSSPELPEDEILAQLLFGRAISEISAFQAAQMAAAVATLTGGGNGIVGSIRDELGVDDLDVTTSDEGETALKVGKYLSDEVYTDVTIDSSGQSVINLNLDASDTVTFKGSASPDGATSLGVFFEKDY
ncbi:translocation/assembly module TamB domain-containing protein [Pacificibacter marinus]|uniref:translocation/assembly module TamB domain-containing protein n=1 Tax=Pacificibacter marinus TaxID=658057 RepID=UPI001C06F899|nr:translocation/assembly module TamB domain-containing protein [Pacificibacter marinus]MBU2867084.1 translocation/assembly module TamB domain-containing protein [Pacificibacter marinus]